MTQDKQDAIGLVIEADQYTVAPGGRLAIPALMVNRGAEESILELLVLGIPEGWAPMMPRVMRLAPNQQASLLIQIQPPAFFGPPQSREVGDTLVGEYPISIRVIDQVTRQTLVERQLKLVVAAYQATGRIGILMESTRFAVAPGESITIPFVVLNHGIVHDFLSLSVEGIPAGWISTPTQYVQLEPGQQQQSYLSIQPPRMTHSKAGRMPFVLRLMSREAPGDASEVKCLLTVGAFIEFDSELRPQSADAEDPMVVLVHNQGNVSEVFTVSWESTNSNLAFEAAQAVTTLDQSSSEQTVYEVEKTFQSVQSHGLRVAAGETGALEFRAAPRKTRWVGSYVTYPFVVNVRDSAGETQSLSGEVDARGLLPFWVLPAALVACLAVLCVVLISLAWLRSSWFTGLKTTSVSQTPPLVQTLAAFQTQVALLTENAILSGTNSVNQTAAASQAAFQTAVANQSLGATQTAVASQSLRATQTAETSQTAAAIAGMQDSDGDGLTDQEEALYKTNPHNPDTDGDLLNDYQEVKVWHTNPLNPDTDNDGLSDGYEVRIGTNPLDPDTDHDGLIDSVDPAPLDPTNPSLTRTAIAGFPKTFTPPPPPITPGPGGPLPPLSGKMAFESNRSGDAEIYLLDMNNYALTRLTNSPGVDTYPALSPDGSKIAFTSNRTGNNEIFVMNLDGSGLTNLTNFPADDQDPTWSPDGKKIAFTSNRDGNQEIYVMNADGSGLRNLTNSPGQDYQPSWFAETNLFFTYAGWIVFTSTRDGNQEIYLMDADGSNQTNLSKNPANDYMPAGQPGKKNVLFVSERDGNPEIYSMTVDGTRLTRLTNNSIPDQSPTWSPASGWIAFMSLQGGNWDIYISKQDGSALYNVTQNLAEDGYPSWY